VAIVFGCRVKRYSNMMTRQRSNWKKWWVGEKLVVYTKKHEKACMNIENALSCFCHEIWRANDVRSRSQEIQPYGHAI